MNDIITKNDGSSFKTETAVRAAIKRSGLMANSYKIVSHEKGGFVGILETAAKTSEVPIPLATIADGVDFAAKVEVPIPVISKKPVTKKVRVHRSNVDPDNKDVQISVCVNTAKNRKIFFPGEEIKLTESEIGVLKDSVEEVQLVIPPDSGIYQANEPMAIARSQYPGMRPAWDKVTGAIIMFKRTPNYLIEYVDG